MMAETLPTDPVKLICGMIVTEEALIDRAREELVGRYGPIDVESGVFAFDTTSYYEAEMGQGLLRKFVSFEKLIDPGQIADIKLETNAIEENFGSREEGSLKRRVNLDPGYIAPAKLVLATAKDFAHRIYLGKGIYAETTLTFTTKSELRFFPWTYPDFKTGRYTDFLLTARKNLVPGSKRKRPAKHAK